MQAIVVNQLGGPEVLEVRDVDMPQPKPGEVLVRVLAAGIGPWDASLRSGQIPAELPFTPGAEFSGVVVGDTGDEAAFEDGEPVYGYPALTGCYAQYVTCPSEQLAPIPAGLGAADAGAVPVAALTAQQGITDHLSVQAGDTVLVTGAAGGVGHFAVQIAARVLGANVIGTASPEQHDFVHSLGASLVVDHLDPDWPEQVRKLTDGGPAKVLACAGQTRAGAARAARDGATVATPVHADSYPEDDRVVWESYNGQPRGSGLIALAPWFDDATIEVHVARRFYWKDAEAAHRQLQAGHIPGKLALVVDDDLAAGLGI
jgi:NADPH:quinone reductase-like Zn-dependent oxidoreductase